MKPLVKQHRPPRPDEAVRDGIVVPADENVPEPAFISTRRHMAVGSAVGRSLLAIGLVILLQTLPLSSLDKLRSSMPLSVATACAFCLYASSDVLSQCASAPRHDVALDISRMMRTGFTASLLSGFLAVFYFRLLEHVFSPLSNWASVVGKIGVDVGMYEPLYDCLYITMQALLRGEGLSVAQREVQSKVLRVWAMAPRYWVAADALNFSLVPLRLRPMTNALFSIPWGMYISSVANAPA